MRHKNERAALLAMLASGIAAVVILRLFDPATTGWFPPCPLRALTGWYCPGCGSLRAAHQLLHGNVGSAFALNPFAVLASPFITYGMLSHACFVLRGRYLPKIFLNANAIHALAVSIVVFGIARNIPVYPLTLLAPGGLSAALK